jgi:hypothetical protein
MVYTEAIRAVGLQSLHRFVLAAQYFGFGYGQAFRLFLMSSRLAIPPSNGRLKKVGQTAGLRSAHLHRVHLNSFLVLLCPTC